jgi:hypothetical protein
LCFYKNKKIKLGILTFGITASETTLPILARPLPVMYHTSSPSWKMQTWGAGVFIEFKCYLWKG